jgi:hypothetical protein
VNCLTYITQLPWTPRFQEVGVLLRSIELYIVYTVPTVDECSGIGCLQVYKYSNVKYNSHPNITHSTVLGGVFIGNLTHV